MKKLSLLIALLMLVTTFLVACGGGNGEESKDQSLTGSSEGSVTGESYVDTIVKIIICVVVGGLVLAGIYALAQTGMDTAQSRTEGLYDYSGD